MSQRLAIAVLIAAFTAGLAHAEKNVELPPVLAKTGKLLAEDDFDRTALGPGYAAAKGEWTIREGTLVGKELQADAHAAVLNVARGNRDSIVRVSFQLKGAEGFHLSLNHAKGHLFRVVVAEKSVVVRTDKDKQDPNSKPETLGRAEANFEQGKWYTLQVEMQGRNVAVSTDNGVKLVAEHASLDVDKPGYRFVMKGENLLLDDVRIWSVAE
jgi:hypothetical protein